LYQHKSYDTAILYTYYFSNKTTNLDNFSNQKQNIDTATICLYQQKNNNITIRYIAATEHPYFKNVYFTNRTLKLQTVRLYLQSNNEFK